MEGNSPSVLRDTNRSIQRDVGKHNNKATAKSKKGGSSRSSTATAVAAENSDPVTGEQGSRDQAATAAGCSPGDAAQPAFAASMHDEIMQDSEEQQQQQEQQLEADTTAAAAAPNGASLAAAAAARLAGGSGSLQQHQQQLGNGTHSEEDEIEDDSDMEQQPQQQQQQTKQPTAADNAVTGGAAADEGSPEAISCSDGEDDDHHQQQQPPAKRGRGRPRRQQQQPSPPPQQEPEQQPSPQEEQAQQPPAGRSRRAAAVAAVGRLRNGDALLQAQDMAPRRSARARRPTAAAAAAAAAGSSEDYDDAPVVRPPRRAAAAAAKEATAAALAAEAGAAPAWAASQPDSDSYLGTPDSSDAEDGGGGSNRRRGKGAWASSGSEGDDDDDDMEDEGEEGLLGSDSWGTGSRKQQRPTRQQPRRNRGGRAVLVDDSDDPDSDEDMEAGDEGQEDGDEMTPGSAAAAAGGGAGDDDQPLDLSAFAYGGGGAGGGRSLGAAAAAAAAGGGGAAKRGQQAKRRGSGGSGDGGGPSEGGGEMDAATLAAVLEAEEALRLDVLEPSEFAPIELAKLPRGDDVDKLVSLRYEDDGSITVLAKLVGRSYRHAVWLPSAAIETKRPHLLRNFINRFNSGDIDNDWSDTHNINPQWYKIDRIVCEYRRGQVVQYLVKWAGLEYSECTWDSEEEVCRDGAGQVALMRFRRWSTLPAMRPTASKRPRQELLDQKLLPAFKNGRKLRDYQEESLHWMINNYRGAIVSGRWKPRNCILGDEMGLGKTAQSIAVIAWLKQYAGASAPCMVVAPLTTLGHWKREIETWTDLNVVLYAGSAEDRRLIREYEFFHSKKTMGPRFHVLLSSYETVLKDKSELKKLQFEAVIVDEAHRMKSQKSATRQALQDMSMRWLLMLSGTPVQNNMRELQGLMSLLDEGAFGNPDDFLHKYGADTPTLEQIRALQAALAPLLLRRMKEDVEDLPEKEEVVIWVELTAEQRRYYRALYSQQIGSLLGGGSNKNLPGMRNLAMELRKLCCHPFLCDGLEDDMTLKWAAAHAAAGGASKSAKELDIENYTRASGKMLLLHKLLPKLRAEGRQVLIFSQFKMMLDVIEDYLTAADYPFERIDGDTKHSDRQAAIDRFMAAKDNSSRQRSKTPGNSRAPSPSPQPAEGATSGQQQQGQEVPGDTTAAAAAANGNGAAGGGSSRGNSRGASPSAAAAAGQEGEGSVPADGPFVFLLSTRAGGQGITLTSADTVIIYDSDWNPQNDLQAMARCHRIGQEKEVTVYRLVSRSTYEQQLFETASRKYGLDEAILGFAGAGDNPENDAARIEQLLRLGAHAILSGGADEAAAAGTKQLEGGAGVDGGAAGGVEEKGFAAEDIDQILHGRSEKRQLGSRKGNTFSIATFGDGGGELDPEQEAAEAEAAAAAAEAAALTNKDAKTFWAELLPEAVAEHAEQAKKKAHEVLGPRRRRQVDYREANMGGPRAASSSDYTTSSAALTGAEEGEGGGDETSSKGTKRAADGEAQQGSGSKKAKKKGDDGVYDPDLGRTLQPWKATQVDIVRDALVRYGMDCLDKVVAQCQKSGLQGRGADEIKQVCQGLVTTLDEMAKACPPLQQAEKDAAMAAAAAANAAAAAAGRPPAATSTTNKNASVAYVNGLRDALIKAGLESKLPPACARALLSLDTMRKMGRSPASTKQLLDDHHKVHLAMLAAGLVPDSSKKAAAAAAAGSSQQPIEVDDDKEEEQKAKAPAAGAGAAAAAEGGADGSKPPRVFVAPRVVLRGSKGLPAWWKRDFDDLLMQGCYRHGYATGQKLVAIVGDIMQDPTSPLHTRFALDPVAEVREQHQQQVLAATTTRSVEVVAPDGSRQVRQEEVVPALPLDAQAMAQAQQAREALRAQRPQAMMMDKLGWDKMVSVLVARLKRVRTALLDPNYDEPATPPSIKYNHMLSSHNLASGAAAAAAGGGGGVQPPSGLAGQAHSVQQRLNLTPSGDGSMTYKGKKVIGGGLPGGAQHQQPAAAAAAAAAQARAAAAQAAAQVRAAPTVGGVQFLPGVMSPQQAQLRMLQSGFQVKGMTMVNIANMAATAANLAQQQQDSRKRQAQESQPGGAAAAGGGGGGANKRPNTGVGGGPSPLGLQQLQAQQQAIAAAAAFQALRQNSLQQQQRALLQAARLQLHQQQQRKQQSDDVVDLVSSDSDEDRAAPPQPPSAANGSKPAATPAGAAAASGPAAAPPSSGLVVRRLPAGVTDLSQEQSVDEEPAAADGAGPGAVNSSGKQHMQQLLGSSSPKKGGSSTGKAAAAGDHPVYGGGAAPAPAAAGRGHKKAVKEDPKQTKLNQFFKSK